MSNNGDLMREVEALRRRISVLSAASLRISASLELDTVLHEIVDSARALTGSGYGLIITLDAAGQPQDFVSAGMSAGAHRRLVEWPDGPRLFEHLRDLPGVLRLADVHAFVRAHGFSADLLPSRTFQGTPMRHQGVHVGNFYLVDKEGGKEFSDDDRGEPAPARHAPESAPIRVSAVRDGVHVALSVSDEGQGVAPERLAHLFNKYAGVVGGGQDSGPGGSGLGLAICKGLVEAHGGRHHGDSKLVRAFIKKLRQKLGDDANAPAYIMTERGVGYRMARPGKE